MNGKKGDRGPVREPECIPRACHSRAIDPLVSGLVRQRRVTALAFVQQADASPRLGFHGRDVAFPLVGRAGAESPEPPAASRISGESKSMSSALRSARVALPANVC